MLETEVETALIGSMALIPQVVDQLHIPVIAAGGIMEGRGIVAAMVLGACAVQMGTAFLTCPESNIHEAHRQALLNAQDDSTCVTKVFTGRYARGIRNGFISGLTPYQEKLLPYPYQRALTRDIVLCAQQQKNPEWMTLWAGQAAMLSRSLSVAELFSQLIREVETLVNSQHVFLNARANRFG